MQIQQVQPTYSQLAPFVEIATDEKPKKNIRPAVPDYRQETADQAKSSVSRPEIQDDSRNLKNLDISLADSKRVKVKINESQRAIVSIVDSKTNEIISEMPPEQMIEILDKLELNLGALLDREV